MASVKEFKKLLTENKLPSHDYLFNLSEAVSSLLEEEKTAYRVPSSKDFVGGLLDFQKDNIPLVVVPDMHGRRQFLLNIINYHLPSNFCGEDISIIDALEKGLIRLIFVGDILHTERNTKERWKRAQEDFQNEIYDGNDMKDEMIDSLGVWCGVFLLKKMFPNYCHILKGNHENILNVTKNGDYSFKKYANEGAMVKAFVEEYYGDDIVYLIHCVEKTLPLVVVSNYCVISHAEPIRGYTKEELVNGIGKAEVVEGLIWTNNGDAKEGSVSEVIRNISDKQDVSDIMYLGGHRCVSDNYKVRQNGVYVQIHNPAKQNVCLIYNNRKFNPDQDIVGVQK